MKAFLVGLAFLLAASVLAVIALFFAPFIFALGLLLRLAVIAVFVIFAIWCLGKFIIFVWETIRK